MTWPALAATLILNMLAVVAILLAALLSQDVNDG